MIKTEIKIMKVAKNITPLGQSISMGLLFVLMSVGILTLAVLQVGL